MPSRKHQCLTTLLVENPELLVELLRRHAGVQVPDDLEVLSGPETARVLGSERVADGAVILHSAGAVRETFVVEVQLRKDLGKRKAWAAYVVGTWTRMGHPATLVVVTHGHKSGSLRLGRTALTVARELLASGDHGRILLAELLVHFTNERVRRTVEAEMEIDGEVYLTKWGKAYGKMRAQALAEGRSQGLSEGETKGRAAGRTEGRVEGLAKALWTVLRGRGLEPTAAQRQRIERCRGVRQLERWLARAVVARTVAEVLRP